MARTYLGVYVDDLREVALEQLQLAVWQSVWVCYGHVVYRIHVVP